MADQKELRRMNRTELIEIIYALQQQEVDLRRENKELGDKLEDRTIRMDNAGSIAEAALSLNHIFEEAQAAADQYLMSVRDEGGLSEDAEPDGEKETAADQAADANDQKVDSPEGEADQTVNTSKAEAERIISEAQTEAERIISEAQAGAELTISGAQAEAERIISEAQAGAELTISEAKSGAGQILDEAREESGHTLEEAQRALDAAQKSIDAAKEKAEQIVNAEQAKAEKILASAQSQAEEIHVKAKQVVDIEKEKFLLEIRKLMNENPELATALRERAKREDDG